MYCADFICTYKLIENESESEQLYRIQFLQAFQSENWDDDIINDKMKYLYDNMKDNTVINDIINNIKKSKNLEMMITLLGDDELTLFKLLFKYELFDFTHKCICNILNNDNENVINENKRILINNL
jgi:hypothetical protein